MTIYDRIKNNINWPLRVNSVLFKKSNFVINIFSYTRRTFSFPTKEMAIEFLETFMNLFKIAIPIL